jgi:hypothetical protein
MNLDRLRLNKEPEMPANMKPSPTMKVHFPNGEVVAMNRRERRRHHLYGDRITRSSSHVR